MRDDFAAGGVNHVAGRGIGKAAVDAKRDPSRLFAKRDARDLMRRRRGHIKNMERAAHGIAEPNLALVGGQPDSVARAAVSHRLAELAPFHFDAFEKLAGHKVADLKTEQSVNRDEAAGPFAVDGERANFGMKGSCGTGHFVLLGVYRRQEWRMQAGAVDPSPIEAANRVMRPAFRLDLGDDRAGLAIDDVPMRA